MTVIAIMFFNKSALIVQNAILVIKTQLTNVKLTYRVKINISSHFKAFYALFSLFELLDT